ncbi:uncharacterized protein LOC121386785 [Gigantopelta aegis]|uniref:uncharacterized protein LOC121386785 n=1 Tax=Gigantopelta aegis TaxID=1735272 RepID=UPI001B88ABB8|nr:uncharacterized protein LOC121386785 [Gigantopelta aegis]
MDEDEVRQQDLSAMDVSASDACSTKNEETEDDNDDLTYSSSDIDFVIDVRIITSDSEGHPHRRGSFYGNSGSESVTDADDSHRSESAHSFGSESSADVSAPGCQKPEPVHRSNSDVVASRSSSDILVVRNRSSEVLAVCNRSSEVPTGADSAGNSHSKDGAGVTSEEDCMDVDFVDVEAIDDDDPSAEQTAADDLKSRLGFIQDHMGLCLKKKVVGPADEPERTSTTSVKDNDQSSKWAVVDDVNVTNEKNTSHELSDDDGSAAESYGPFTKPNELTIKADQLVTRPDGATVKTGGLTSKADRPVTRPDGPTVKTGGLTSKADRPVTRPDGPTVKTGGLTSKADRPVTRPDGPTVKTGGLTAETGGLTSKADRPVTRPDGPTVKTGGLTAETVGLTSKADRPVTRPDGPTFKTGGPSAKTGGLTAKAAGYVCVSAEEQTSCMVEIHDHDDTEGPVSFDDTSHMDIPVGYVDDKQEMEGEKSEGRTVISADDDQCKKLAICSSSPIHDRNITRPDGDGLFRNLATCNTSPIHCESMTSPASEYRNLIMSNSFSIHHGNIARRHTVSSRGADKLDSVCETSVLTEHMMEDLPADMVHEMDDLPENMVHPADRHESDQCLTLENKCSAGVRCTTDKQESDQFSALESDTCTTAVAKTKTKTLSDSSDVCLEYVESMESGEDGNNQEVKVRRREMSEDIFSDTSPTSDVDKNNAFINEQLLILNSESSHLNTSIHHSGCKKTEHADPKLKPGGKRQQTPKKGKLGGRIRKSVKRKLEEFDSTERRAKKPECSTSVESDSDSTGSLQIDEEVVPDDNIDDKLEKNAEERGLTATNVKNILHHLITNEDVVDMLKNSVLEGMTNDEKNMVEAAFEPKMTRAAVRKAIETGQVPNVWPLSPMKKKTPKPSILDMDFPDDEDDDEYNPENDAEAHESDDDESVVSSRISEFGSPCPPTPLTPSSCLQTTPSETQLLSQEKTSPTETSPDRARSLVIGQQFRQAMQSIISSSELENNSTIAERTRSKLPLKDTSLIEIEEALCFVAPDITPDMYDTYCDDSDWQDFIRSLIGPEFEQPDPVEVVDDEATDPEYDYLAEADTVVTDPEDFRFDKHFRVSKKELTELMDELHVLFPEPDDEDERIEITSGPEASAPKPLTVAEMARSEVMSPQLHVSPEQKLMIEDHMRKHIQLTCQMYVLCLGSEDYQSMAPSCVQILRELDLFKTVSVAGVNSSFNVCNLLPALELIEGDHNWNISKEVEEMSHDDTGSNATDSDVESVDLTKSRNPHKKVMKKGSLLMSQKDLLWNSPVFLYPHLLLKRRLLSQDETLDLRVCFTPAEDNLIALGMEQFHRMPMYCKYIQKYMMPCKSVQQIKIHIKNFCVKRAADNPIKFYRKHKKPPEFPFVIDHFTPERMQAPKDQDMCLLPPWCLKYREFLRKEFRAARLSSQVSRKKRSSSLSFGEVEESAEPKRYCHSAPDSPANNEFSSVSRQKKKRKPKKNIRLTVEDLNKDKPVTITPSKQATPRVIVMPGGLFIPIHMASNVRQTTTESIVTQASQDGSEIQQDVIGSENTPEPEPADGRTTGSTQTVRGVISLVPGKTSHLTISVSDACHSDPKETSVPEPADSSACHQTVKETLSVVPEKNSHLMFSMQDACDSDPKSTSVLEASNNSVSPERHERTVSQPNSDEAGDDSTRRSLMTTEIPSPGPADVDLLTTSAPPEGDSSFIDCQEHPQTEPADPDPNTSPICPVPPNSDPNTSPICPVPLNSDPNTSPVVTELVKNTETSPSNVLSATVKTIHRPGSPTLCVSPFVPVGPEKITSPLSSSVGDILLTSNSVISSENNYVDELFTKQGSCSVPAAGSASKTDTSDGLTSAGGDDQENAQRECHEPENLMESDDFQCGEPALEQTLQTDASPEGSHSNTENNSQASPQNPSSTCLKTTKSPASSCLETTKSPASTCLETTKSSASSCLETTKSPASTCLEIAKSPASTFEENTKSPASTCLENTKSPASSDPSGNQEPLQTESGSEINAIPVSSNHVPTHMESRSPLEIIAALSPYYAQAVMNSPKTKTYQQNILEKTPTKKTRLKTIKPKAASEEPSLPTISPFLEKIHKSPKRAQLQKQARSILPKGFVVVDAKVSPTKIVARGLKRRAQMFAQRVSPCKLLPKTEVQRSPISITLAPRETKRKRTTRKQKKRTSRSVYSNESDFSDEPSDIDELHTDGEVSLRRRSAKDGVDDADSKLDESDEVPSDDAAGLSQDDSQTEDHLDDLMAASTTIRFTSKKHSVLDRNSLTKSQKKRELTLAMLAPDLLETDPRKDEKDTAFAQAYLSRAKQVLKDDFDIYEHFIRYMYEFGKGGLPVEKLFNKVQSLFHKYPELSSDFAAFLSPHQAVACGCFMANQEFIKARTFLRKLEIYFEKQQSQFQRVLKAFHTWFQQPGKLTKDLKESVQPLLKGLPYLLDEFSMFFPEDKPPETIMGDYEEVTLNDSDLEVDAEIDSAEEIEIPDELETYRTKRCRCDCHSNPADIKLQKRLRHCYNCSLRVIDGRLYFQTSSKKITPVKITFHKPVTLPRKRGPTPPFDEDEESDFEVADKENINITSRPLIVSPSTSSHASPAKARRIKLKHVSQKSGLKRFMTLNEVASQESPQKTKNSSFSSPYHHDDTDHFISDTTESQTASQTTHCSAATATATATATTDSNNGNSNENKNISPSHSNTQERKHFLSVFGDNRSESAVENNTPRASELSPPTVSQSDSQHALHESSSLRDVFDSSTQVTDPFQSCTDILASAMRSAHIKPSEESMSIDFFQKLLSSNFNLSGNNSPVKQQSVESTEGSGDKQVEQDVSDGTTTTRSVVASDLVQKFVLAGLTQSRNSSPRKDPSNIDSECGNSQHVQMAVEMMQKFAEAGLASASQSKTSLVDKMDNSSTQLGSRCKAEQESEDSQHSLLSIEQMHRFLEAGLRSRTSSPVKTVGPDQQAPTESLSDSQLVFSAEFIHHLLEISNSVNSSPSKKTLSVVEKEQATKSRLAEDVKSECSQHAVKSTAEPSASTSMSLRQGNHEQTSSNKYMDTNNSCDICELSSVQKSEDNVMEVVNDSDDDEDDDDDVDEDDEDDDVDSDLSQTAILQAENETSPSFSRQSKLKADSKNLSSSSTEGDACAMLSAESDSSEEPFLETETSSDMDSDDSSLSDRESVTSKQEPAVVWTREMDKVLILRYKMIGAIEDTCKVVSKELKVVTPNQVAERFSQMTAIIEDTEEDWDSDSS